MQKVVEASTEKVRMGETEGERSKGKNRKKMGEERKDGRSKESSRGMGNMG